MRRDTSKTRKKRSAPPRVYRFDARLDEDLKRLIQRAADLEGRTMTDFVLQSAQVAAERTIQERAMLLLRARDTEAFVAAILNPAEPGPALRAAARAYKTRVRAKTMGTVAQLCLDGRSKSGRTDEFTHGCQPPPQPAR